MKSLYLVLSGLRASEVNAISGMYATGVPALTAFAGLVHALQRDLNNELAKQSLAADDFDFGDVSKVRVDGFSVYFTYFNESDAIARRSGYQFTSATTALNTPAMQHAPLVTVEAGLVLKLQGGPDVIKQAQAFLESSAGASLLTGKRIAGGTIFTSAKPVVVETVADAMARVPAGAVLLEGAAQEMADAMTANNNDAVEAIVQLVSRPNRFTAVPAAANTDKPAKATGRSKKPVVELSAAERDPQEASLLTQKPAPLKRFIAIGVGYRKLRQIQLPGDPYPRFLTEPVVGVARVRRIESVRKALRDGLTPSVFWHQDKPTPGGYFLVSPRSEAQAL